MEKKRIDKDDAKNKDYQIYKNNNNANDQCNEEWIANLKKIGQVVSYTPQSITLNSLEDVKKLAEKTRRKIYNQKKVNLMVSFPHKPLCKALEKSVILCEEFLLVYDRVVNWVFSKDGKPFSLWNTQKVAIATMIGLARGKVLVQVSTGEGKSLIVAGVAIFYVLSGKKVDIVTSSGLLAIRDSTLSVSDGGLGELYAAFGIDVANNCSEQEYERIKAYNSAVVYGELSSFQRDYLLDTFHKRNIRGERPFDCFILDEVDCMLLDRGNNVLYLSHDIPGMEMVESLYVFIWDKVKKTPRNSLEAELGAIKSAILYDLYGKITKDDLQSSVQIEKEQLEEVWFYLIQIQVIDPNGRLKMENHQEIKDKIKYVSDQYLERRLVYFFRGVANRERRIRIPSHLLPFVNRNLDSWLENALLALELEPGEDYVVDHDRTDTNPDLNPQVIIIDPDLGTDLPSSEWGGSLHQFLQLKEGCQLTLQSLKSIYISNTKYTKLYEKQMGVSGTLGTEPERKFLHDTFFFRNQFIIPRAFPRQFIFKPTRIFKTEDVWLKAITKEALQTAIMADKVRSIIIFCRSINVVHFIYRQLKETFSSELASGKVKIHRYTRSYEVFTFESSNGLGVGHIIVTTNLAGRGTDIKIDDELRENGGLHVCLTYFPKNMRVEEQAIGRAGRKGENRQRNSHLVLRG